MRLTMLMGRLSMARLRIKSIHFSKKMGKPSAFCFGGARGWWNKTMIGQCDSIFACCEKKSDGVVFFSTGTHYGV